MNETVPLVSVPVLSRETQHIHAGEDLDGRELLDEHLLGGEADRRDSEREADEQHETLWDHADDARDDIQEAVAPLLRRQCRDVEPVAVSEHAAADHDDDDRPEDP